MELIIELAQYLDLEGRPSFFTFIYWVSIALVALTILCYGYLAYSRLSFIYLRYRKQQVLNDWQKVFNAIRKGKEPKSLPATSRSNRKYLLELWYEERELANEKTEASLDELARRINLADAICNILRPGKLEILPQHVWLQALAINSARYIDTEETRKMVSKLAESDSIFLAAQACACMAKLKIEGYEKAIMSIMFRFPGNIPDIFDEVSRVGGADVLLVMEPLLNRLPYHTLMNFISLAANSEDERLLPMMRSRLQASHDNEEIAAIIRLMGKSENASLKEVIEPFLNHESTFVRVQAARAFGRLASYGEHEVLIPLLSDSNWWLRYRAARALVKLIDSDAETLDQIKASLTDRYAQEILTHAYEEMEWCLT